jgi:hypothetical protein
MVRTMLRLLVVLIGCATSLSASDFLRSRWTVGVEYLYLKPSVDDTYFVISGIPNDSGIPNGKKFNNDFGFHSGWGLYGKYNFCDSCLAFTVDYKQLQAKAHKAVNGSGVWGVNGPPVTLQPVQFGSGTAVSNNTLFYQRIDALLSQTKNYCGFGLSFYEGLEVANIWFRQKVNYVGVDDEGISSPVSTKNSSQLWGGGPQFGLDGYYELLHCRHCMPGVLSLKALATGSLLVSHTKQEVNVNMGDIGAYIVDDDSTWRIIPALHARVGLNYTSCLCNTLVALELGYQFDFYHKGIARETFTDSASPGAAFVEYLDLGLQGLYIALNVGF